MTVHTTSPSYDYAGANWTSIDGDAYDLSTTTGIIATAGNHYNIDTFTIPSRVTVYVQDYDDTNYGTLDIRANNVTFYEVLI